jgi:hypothetical protein
MALMHLILAPLLCRLLPLKEIYLVHSCRILLLLAIFSYPLPLPLNSQIVLFIIYILLILI